jgi:hypothetical protein
LQANIPRLPRSSLHHCLPYAIHTVLTDNGTPFTNQPATKSHSTATVKGPLRQSRSGPFQCVKQQAGSAALELSG